MMNKSLLIKQNKQLFDKLHISELSNNRLKEELAALKKSIAHLEAEIESLKSNGDEFVEATDTSETVGASEDVIETPEETKDNIVLGEDIEYGSKIIGEIVVQAALASNKLKEIGHPNIKELVNLILGRTEVSKGEILNIISSNVSIDAKIKMINDVKTQVFEYFNSILEQ